MNVIIRPYESKDLEALRQIACDTVFMGKPYHHIVSNAEVVADVITLCYTQYEPESCLVAEIGGKVVGYLIGTKDIRRMNKIKAKMIPRITLKIIRHGLLFNKKNLKFLWFNLFSFFKGETRKEDYAIEYPATGHINVDHQYQSRGIASKLLGESLHYLRKNNIPGVQVSINTEAGKNFFSKHKFNFLYSQKRSELRYLIHQDFTNYIYGLKL